MTTPPPPPPGTGSNQPYDPSGSAPPPPGQGQPSYGSDSGQPPQAPPPAPGGAPQGGSDKAKIMAIISIVLGVIGLCCCPSAIVGLVLGFLSKKEYDERGESATLAVIGIAISGIMLALAILSLILQWAGVIDIYSFDFETS